MVGEGGLVEVCVPENVSLADAGFVGQDVAVELTELDLDLLFRGAVCEIVGQPVINKIGTPG